MKLISKLLFVTLWMSSALGATAVQAASGPQLAGTVTVTDRAGVRIHSYVAPANGWLVNSQIVEGKLNAPAKTSRRQCSSWVAAIR